MTATVPSWDLFISLFFVIGIAYGIILQRDRVVACLLSVYVALLVSEQLVEPIGQFFQGDKTLFNQIWIRSNTSPFTIQTGLFIAIVVLLSAKGGLGHGRSRGGIGNLEVLVYSFLNTALIVASIFSFLPEATLEAYRHSSKLVAMLMQYQQAWQLLPVVALIFFGFQRHPRRLAYEDEY
ncbi:MAG: Uncharacterized protein CEO22_95 [Candidatus Berkelbacteria bacterium Gr01-1014_85]|uniref:Colicin V production protein n=1 Tax=Candidatus Berkelbacteria bacterium Gr01-1014_85 TaxID=2017150 RepID=A0A554JDH2_9BACT|nr:MAG: Uncharacterized protein CEO22_95 [Candidatus Berkelbacteria bacterium Gr01-1014_85]